ncbi:hypothetical protein [Arthrobacter sp. NPDC058127]|uniref:hypothetical protein n=1 Tax=Arthrobacter sp. NPDC058127 TaxID=3346351 RepID=UPI0036E77C89
MKSLKDQKKFRNIKAGDLVEIQGLSFKVRSAEPGGRTIELELEDEAGGVITLNGVPDARITSFRNPGSTTVVASPP